MERIRLTFQTLFLRNIFSWLDAYVRNLDAIRRIAKAFGKKDIVQVSEKLMKIVESGK